MPKQDLLGALFKNSECYSEQEKESIICVRAGKKTPSLGIDKPVPWDHRLPS